MFYRVVRKVTHPNIMDVFFSLRNQIFKKIGYVWTKIDKVFETTLSKEIEKIINKYHTSKNCGIH
jgi:hypothetical protein